MQTYFEGDQVSLFDQDTSAGRTCRAYSAQDRRTGRISGLSWRRLLDYIAPPYQFLDLTPGAGNLLGQFEWEMRSALHGGAFLRNTGPSPRDATESCLSQILEDHPPKKYYLTTAACLGILRRAKERGKPLPQALDTALQIQAGLIGLPESRGETVLLDASAAFAQPGMRQQTFAASFSAGASATAGTIGYAEEVAPTLKGSPSGNCMPSVLCVNDQGGQRIDLSEDVSGTLRASEKGHQPLVYENHGIDARVRESGEISPTVTARFGTGGGNTPLVQEPNEVYCIVGNIIDRQPENGGNGCGYQADLAYTLTAADHHAIAQPYQDERMRGEVLLIRRLTPLECERLQGFPDDWTDIPGSSDSVRYRALGNSVAIPCVDFIMKSLREVIELEAEQSQVQGDYHAEK